MSPKWSSTIASSSRSRACRASSLGGGGGGGFSQPPKTGEKEGGRRRVGFLEATKIGEKGGSAGEERKTPMDEGQGCRCEIYERIDTRGEKPPEPCLQARVEAVMTAEVVDRPEDASAAPAGKQQD